MRKIIYTILLCSAISFDSYAQTESPQVVAEIKRANLKKTGNWQDVFANFYQIAIENLVGEKKSFEFKSTLFALRSSINPSLLVDTEYIKKKNVFDRNLQINAALQLDSTYKFKGANIGFTWAIINKRDSAILSFVGKEKALLNGTNKQYFDAVTHALVQYGDNPKHDEVVEALAVMEQNGVIDPTKLPEDFLKICPKDKLLLFNAVANTIRQKIEETKKKPFLSLRVNAAFKNGNGIFNGGEAELVYLQGLTKSNRPLELDLRLKATLADTAVGGLTKRTVYNFTGGFNYAIISSRIEHSPIVEFKPHVEYNYITRGLTPGEVAKVFTANATLRVRIFKNVWLPFTLKYDVENNNMLGFLNVAINWDAFKVNKKG